MRHHHSQPRWSMLRLVAALGTVTLWFACTHGEKKQQTSDSKSTKDDEAQDTSDPEVTVSATRTTLVQSLSNNPLTNRTVSKQKADEQAAKLEPQKNSKDKRSIEGLLAAQRLAGRPLSEVVGSARRIAELEMRRNVEREISDEVKLELALAGVQQQKFAFAEYYIDQILKSKDAKVRAGALNLAGVLAVRQDRIPEAVLLFRESLKASGTYRAAQLNLGFLALGGGDFALAKKMLGEMQEDWFAQSGLLVVSRLEGDVKQADSTCDRVLSKRSDHKPTLFNCGLHEYQAKKNYDKAKELLTKMTKARSPGGERWDEKAFRLIADVDVEKNMQADRKREAEEAKKLQQQQKATPQAPAAGAGPAANAPAAGK